MELHLSQRTLKTTLNKRTKPSKLNKRMSTNDKRKIHQTNGPPPQKKEQQIIKYCSTNRNQLINTMIELNKITQQK